MHLQTQNQPPWCKPGTCHGECWDIPLTYAAFDEPPVFLRCSQFSSADPCLSFIISACFLPLPSLNRAHVKATQNEPDKPSLDLTKTQMLLFLVLKNRVRICFTFSTILIFLSDVVKAHSVLQTSSSHVF